LGRVARGDTDVNGDANEDVDDDVDDDVDGRVNDGERGAGAPAANMERVRRLAAIWSWLPAFRVVAELQHLPSAAKRLGTSASALSRSVRLLEDAVGRPLFLRKGRALVLDDAGKLLLAGTRDAMRLLDDALLDVRGERATGPFRIAADDAVQGVALDALAALREREPRLSVVEISLPRANEAAAALLRGEIDAVVVLGAPAPVRGLSAFAAGHIDVVVAAGAGDPALSAAAPLTPATLCGRAFAIVSGAPAVEALWPPAEPRTLAIAVARQASAVALARNQRALALLPLPLPAGLRTVPVVGFPRQVPVFVIVREQLRPGGPAEAYVGLAVESLVRYQKLNEL
jgi:DNA-binding transcriptional LysR family regulator